MSHPKDIDPASLHARLARGEAISLLDVREPDEVAICSLAGSLNVPLRQVPARSAEIPRDSPLVVYCHSGLRSLMAGRFLLQQGFHDVYNLRGGIDAWAATVDPRMARY